MHIPIWHKYQSSPSTRIQCEPKWCHPGYPFFYWWLVLQVSLQWWLSLTVIQIIIAINIALRKLIFLNHILDKIVHKLIWFFKIINLKITGPAMSTSQGPSFQHVWQQTYTVHVTQNFRKYFTLTYINTMYVMHS